LNHKESKGVNPAEIYINKLCKHSFLSLWSYSNLYTDEGRKVGKGCGHELCDLLVVSGNDIIIFSVKSIKYNKTIDTEVAWTRWFKKAVQQSSYQLYGAENWLKKYSNRIYRDPQCQSPFPLPIPTSEKIRIHRVAVALGIKDACRDFRVGNGLGSLIIKSDLSGDAHYKNPFCVGHVNREKGFVHVFEDFTIDTVLKELDTVTDFIEYLSKRENFLSREKPIIIAFGDEQLLAIYLTHQNIDNKHDFIYQDEGQELICFDGSHWNGLLQHPKYKAKKQADEISYVWDEMIEHFIKIGGIYNGTENRSQDDPDFERILRYIALEPRIRRRHLAGTLYDLLTNTPHNIRNARLAYSDYFIEKAYVFFILPVKNGEKYEMYRICRKSFLLAYCKVAKLCCPNASYIIGIATENDRNNGTSWDMILLDVREWSEEQQMEAKSLQKEWSLFLNENIKKYGIISPEWPEVRYK